MSGLLSLILTCAPAVAPTTMAAIVAVESGGNPYAIGVNRGLRVRQPGSKDEAVATARSLLARGQNIDLGIGQINSSNLKWLGLSVEDAFDPCKNLSAASRILSGNYERAIAQGSSSPLGAAISAYNTGSMTRGYANGYVAKVYRASGLSLPDIASAPQAATPVAGLQSPEPLINATPAAQPPEPAAWDVFARARSGFVWSAQSSQEEK